MEKYTVKVIKHFEFLTKEEADAFADFQRASEDDTPECLGVEVETSTDNKQAA